ncbi:helix-turn-helix domain-containing protein [Halobacteriovorax sp. GB3]|uniref:helix-turn-helix domain-containing protein n=1 Tax=Halobacteriovorax sp. GB3 TaxID=2719615 RepID=UPI002362CF77|nr:helix-turn-helix domain-containing protein [Halobacteriovorax sp. GB3]MDD0854749.1 helix-turn-helix domain-containing protein [Halobacteriovorax sp. GB3]
MELSREWLSISEYSEYYGISTSTIRRYIKTERVRYQKINGKFFIFDRMKMREKSRELDFSVLSKDLALENEMLKSKVAKLEAELRELRVQIN